MSGHMGQIVSTVITVLFALTVIFVRTRGSNRPVTARKIIMPPLGMSTGFLMFLAPQTRDPWLYAGLAFCAGLIFSYPLILTSKMRIVDNQIFLKRSKGFVLILLALLVLRIVLHQYVEQYVTIVQTGSLFFILAFGMIAPWRVAMLLQYRKLQRQLGTSAELDLSPESEPGRA
ncbi:cytochrome c biogenesis protein CcdC [Alicyclobacillus cycloheptanicus]|uniref:Membrane protein CcdC involved in cytochrome C biogenesis n=1 Tax=Alicyclobacillus cycloheptanicus TaxID=1457 RepID=A0ABT9XK74_9BACL|nr:cytochrome c biogenesis protein CcdC [Alicyclobacillus cycloheptanicus]MDQ0190707.1 membrane protein CcdC involved in cytochrome C biogenesis [Alicyclobacillus cycloheptanicus]WDM00280.1 cytochrome c biogenesis protein CcdC [Alicyclobacillus cycloheptanicus]